MRQLIASVSIPTKEANLNDSAPLLGPLLQHFFAEHLLRQRSVSPQTVASYRDIFRLLLEFLRNEYQLEPAALRITNLDAPSVLRFLDHLELKRRNSAFADH